jgi:hypothetical protein
MLSWNVDDAASVISFSLNRVARDNHDASTIRFTDCLLQDKPFSLVLVLGLHRIGECLDGSLRMAKGSFRPSWPTNSPHVFGLCSFL